MHTYYLTVSVDKEFTCSLIRFLAQGLEMSAGITVTSRTGQERICFCTHIVIVRTQFVASCCQFLSAMLVKHGLQLIALGASAV